MTYRDPMPELPPCPVCDRVDGVKRHDKEHQGRFLCMACMLLFDGTSAEWIGPRERQPAQAEIDKARAALEKAVER